MQRRSSGIYEFRKRLPKELAGKPAPEHAKQYVPELVNPATGRFKRELTVSLGTNDPKAAKRRDLAEALKAVDLFEKATLLIAQGPAAKLSPQPLPEVSNIEAWAFRKILASDEETRRQGDLRRQSSGSAGEHCGAGRLHGPHQGFHQPLLQALHHR